MLSEDEEEGLVVPMVLRGQSRELVSPVSMSQVVMMILIVR